MKHIAFLIVLLFVASAAFAQGASHSVTLNWNWTQGTGDAANGFNCKRSQVSGGPYTTVVIVPTFNTLSCIDTNVVAGQTFFYVVTAFNAAGESTPTNEVKAVVSIGPPAPAFGLTVTVR